MKTTSENESANLSSDPNRREFIKRTVGGTVSGLAVLQGLVEEGYANSAGAASGSCAEEREYGTWLNPREESSWYLVGPAVTYPADAESNAEAWIDANLKSTQAKLKAAYDAVTVPPDTNEINPNANPETSVGYKLVMSHKDYTTAAGSGPSPNYLYHGRVHYVINRTW